MMPAEGATAPLLEARGLCKSYGRTRVIEEASFAIEGGQIVLFLGPNGAGKTTLLSIVAGMLRPDAGTLSFGGCPRRGALRFGGWVEEPDFPPHLSGWRALELDCWLRGRRLDRDTTLALATEIHLDAAALRTRVGVYSTGMRRKLGILRAIQCDPDLLLLDEPTSGLDPEGIRDMRGILRRLSERSGATILLSSHLIAEAQKVATRTLVLHGGRIHELPPDGGDLESRYFALLGEAEERDAAR